MRIILWGTRARAAVRTLGARTQCETECWARAQCDANYEGARAKREKGDVESARERCDEIGEGARARHGEGVAVARGKIIGNARAERGETEENARRWVE